MYIEFKKRIITSVFLISLLALMYIYSFVMMISLIIIGLISWIEFYALISKILKKKDFNDKFLRFLYKAISLIYISLLIYCILVIESHYPHYKTYLLFIILISILTDVGGLLVGKFFKGKKLTKISPNKTISGSIGSFLFSLVLIPFFSNIFIIYNFYELSMIIILISFTSQLGDLFISYLKRKASVKNTSDILPGHGGFLDRIDGMIFAIPIGVLLFNFY